MEAILKLKDIYKALYDFEKQYAKFNELTINEAIVLYALRDGKPIIANKIYKFVGLSKSRMSRVMAEIENKGYVARQTGVEDKRNIFFFLTSLGREKLNTLMAQKINFSALIDRISSLS